jgi:hypothetical protein
LWRVSAFSWLVLISSLSAFLSASAFTWAAFLSSLSLFLSASAFSWSAFVSPDRHLLLLAWFPSWPAGVPALAVCQFLFFMFVITLYAPVNSVIRQGVYKFKSTSEHQLCELSED